jgi:hypothetical protein
MNIDPLTSCYVCGTSTGASPTRPTERPTETSSQPAMDSTFSPTTDLLRLLGAVREQPEVRSDVVAAATVRVQSGDVTAPGAASATANAILDSVGS